jgi:two-component system, LytTR family, sensor kinase
MAGRITELPDLRRNLFLIWGLLAIENWSRYYVWYYGTARWRSSLSMTGYALTQAAMWLVTSWVIFRMMDYTAAWSRGAALLMAGLTISGCTAATTLFKAWCLITVGWLHGLPYDEALTRLLRGDVHLALMWITAIAAMGRGLQWWHVEESGALRVARLESKATEAALAVVAAQIEPHFLFNTLSGISTLAARDAGRAHEMIDGLLALLEYPTRNCLAVPLREEVRFAVNYLRLQQVRFAERLNVSLEIDETTLDFVVPHLILQPIVENAITHGIAHLEEEGLITIGARLEGESLHLFVRNSEADDACPHDSSSHGVGLASANARLDLLFGHRHSLAIDRADAGNVTLHVIMPAQKAAA